MAIENVDLPNDSGRMRIISDTDEYAVEVNLNARVGLRVTQLYRELYRNNEITDDDTLYKLELELERVARAHGNELAPELEKLGIVFSTLVNGMLIKHREAFKAQIPDIVEKYK